MAMRFEATRGLSLLLETVYTYRGNLRRYRIQMIICIFAFLFFLRVLPKSKLYYYSRRLIENALL